jgi:acetyltransferase-like isoleucine patch superfamily enzyme
LHLIEDVLRNFSGGLGRKLRYAYYKYRLGSCGKNVQIDEGVYFVNPKYIKLEDNIWIDKNVILIAGKGGDIQKTKTINLDGAPLEGEIIIGRFSHIGISTIIQGHGGIQIGEYFTSSSGCKIYTLSNDPQKCRQGTYGTKEIYYILSPVIIENNVWLGLNVTVIGGYIAKDTFISPNSVVFGTIPANSFASGNPAKFIKSRFT